MLQFCLCMLLGAYITHQAELLPSVPWIMSLGVVTTALLTIRQTRTVGALLLGFVVTSTTATKLIDSRLDPALEGQTVQFTATIADFPSSAGEALRFVVVQRHDSNLPERIRLSWYDADTIPGPGEQWQFKARLRAPRGFANPHAFDYEAWLFRQRIAATGYVVSALRTDARDGLGPIVRLRLRFFSRIHAGLPDDAARAVLAAVTIGARQDISRSQWDRYARTGTSHLMAISGLHIGLAATGIFMLTRLLAAPFARGRNVRDLAMMAATVGAFVYGMISGLAVPAQRALLMVVLVASAMLLRRQLSFFNMLSLVAVIVFFGDPLALLAAGFQLSFLAVLLLLFVGQQSAPDAAWPGRSIIARRLAPLRRLTTLQVVLLLGLMPLTVLHFGRIAWVAPITNLLVLPVFNLCTVPLALTALLLDGPLQFAGDQLLQLAWQSVRLVLWIVERASGLPMADLQTLPVQGGMLVVLWAPALWALLPPGFPGRALAWIAALAVIVHDATPPATGCVDVHVLDVGQGLSVVLQTRSQLVVFDTGPSFRSGSDTAMLVLVPFVRSLGAERIDTLIVSHADLDHAGGVATVLEAFPVDELLYGERLSIDTAPSTTLTQCVAGQHWRRDGIDFRVLHPDKDSTLAGNNSSCVVEVSAGRNRVLLAADIERPVELMLTGRSILDAAQLVVVPHHGSRTSSSAPFVTALESKFAVVSAGFGNRWGFPRPDIVRRWEQSGAIVLTTATSGAVSQRICSHRPPSRPREQRREHRRYWHSS